VRPTIFSEPDEPLKYEYQRHPPCELTGSPAGRRVLMVRSAIRPEQLLASRLDLTSYLAHPGEQIDSG